MKKVLLSSVVALTLFAAAAPVFAQGENAESSNQLIQKKYVSWRDAADEAEKQVNAHDAEIRAEATRQPAVVAAQAALDSYGSGHQYAEYVARRDAAFNEAYNVVRNRYRQVFEQRYIAAAQAQGNYYNETAEEANRTNSQRIAEDQAAQSGAAANNGAKPGTPASKEEAKKSEAAAKNAGKAATKALPKTSAVKQLIFIDTDVNNITGPLVQ